MTADDKVYGGPFGGFMGGGDPLQQAGLRQARPARCPKTWAEFMANNAKIKAAGIAPVIQTYGDTWTSQLFVLGDFHNVAAAEPDFADEYTAEQGEVRRHPGRAQGLRAHRRRSTTPGYVNKDFASAKTADGLQDARHGQGRAVPDADLRGRPHGRGDLPRRSQRRRLLRACPVTTRAKNGLTVWTPGGIYIPKTTTEGDKLDAAKKFLAFVASPDGCDAQTKAAPPTGPYVVKGCTLPADVTAGRQGHADRTSTSRARPAWRWSSSRRSRARRWSRSPSRSAPASAKAKDGAALYDEDVKKQAQQLGLPGW